MLIGVNSRTLISKAIKIMGLAENIKNSFSNFLGWKTSRKILVIESDDWGTIRMPSKKTYDVLTGKGIKLDSCYNRFDAIETQADLELLFDLLGGVKNSNNKNPLITANYLTANPDFRRIRESNFEEYFCTSIEKDSEENPLAKESLNTAKKGLEEKLFFPQFHGREHLNFKLWLRALKENDKPTRISFDNFFFALDTNLRFIKRGHFLSALDVYELKDFKLINDTLTDGINMFERIFGYRPKSFIAPNYVWHKDSEAYLVKEGVEYIQGQRKQVEPLLNSNGYDSKLHYTGQKNNLGQRYLVRNVHFEPSSDDKIDWVEHCMEKIASSFTFRTPCILSTHRVNFMGSIVESNRTQNLKKFKSLLKKIVTRWPQVEFMNSVQLGELIKGNNN